MIDWTEILKNIGLGSVVIGAISYLAKTLITNFFKKQQKTHEVELNAEHERSLEKLRNDLEKMALEHEMRFSKLHEKRAQVIERLYKLVVESSFFVKSFLSPLHLPSEPNKKEKAKNAFQKLSELTDYYDKNRIYFDSDVCEVIDEFIEKIREPAYKFKNVLHFQESDNFKLQEIHTETWFESWEQYEEKVQPMKNELENEFRKTLGVNK